MEASNFVEGVDLAFKIIFGIGIFFLVGITTVMIYFVIRYRRSKHPKAEQIRDNNVLEVTWTVIPLLLVLLMFYYGYIAFSPMRDVPENAYEITVIGKMWSWTFEYPGGKQSTDMVVPLNRPIKCNLVSTDVIHAFYVPAYRIKEDVVPGKNNYLWFLPEQLGEYDILCTVYCGVRHSFMEAKVIVVPEAEFNAWLAALPDPSSEPEGLTILKKNACTGCHSVDGSKLVSTSFKGLYGSEKKVITNGSERTVKADDDYIKAAIFDPNRDIVVGYQKGIMKSYTGIVKEDEIPKIIDYLKTIK